LFDWQEILEVTGWTFWMHHPENFTPTRPFARVGRSYDVNNDDDDDDDSDDESLARFSLSKLLPLAQWIVYNELLA